MGGDGGSVDPYLTPFYSESRPKTRTILKRMDLRADLTDALMKRDALGGEIDLSHSS